jgi:hypothetical protein
LSWLDRDFSPGWKEVINFEISASRNRSSFDASPDPAQWKISLFANSHTPAPLALASL